MTAGLYVSPCLFTQTCFQSRRQNLTDIAKGKVKKAKKENIVCIGLCHDVHSRFQK